MGQRAHLAFSARDQRHHRDRGIPLGHRWAGDACAPRTSAIRRRSPPMGTRTWEPLRTSRKNICFANRKSTSSQNLVYFLTDLDDGFSCIRSVAGKATSSGCGVMLFNLWWDLLKLLSDKPNCHLFDLFSFFHFTKFYLIFCTQSCTQNPCISLLAHKREGEKNDSLGGSRTILNCPMNWANFPDAEITAKKQPTLEFAFQDTFG